MAIFVSFNALQDFIDTSITPDFKMIKDIHKQILQLHVCNTLCKTQYLELPFYVKSASILQQVFWKFFTV